jgi:hypothetical protein
METGKPSSAQMPWLDNTQVGKYHYAKNRSSFKSYRRVTGTPQGIPVIGIGIIELRVQTSPNSSNNTAIVLQNILHIPDPIFNSFNGGPRMSKSMSTRYPFTRDWVQVKDQQTRRAIWHGTKFCGLNKLALVDDPQGESKLPEPLGDLKRDKPPAWMLSCTPEEEIKNLFPPSRVYTGPVSSISSYNPFLKHFLRQPKGSWLLLCFASCNRKASRDNLMLLHQLTYFQHYC